MAFSLERENYVRSGLEGRAYGRGGKETVCPECSGVCLRLA